MGDSLKHKEHVKTSDLIRITSRFVVYSVTLATLAFGGSKLFTSEARAEPPRPTPAEVTRRPAGPTEKQPPTGPREEAPPGSKEAETPKTPKPLDPELAKLKKVSLAEMQRLDKETCKKYECGAGQGYGALQNDGKLFVAGVARIPVNDGHNMTVSAHIGISLSGTKRNLLVAVVNDKDVATPEFDELARLYKLATGNTLKYVRLVVDSGGLKDETIGEYVGVYVIPVETPGGDIKAGAPFYKGAYSLKTGKYYSDTDYYLLTDQPKVTQN